MMLDYIESCQMLLRSSHDKNKRICPKVETQVKNVHCHNLVCSLPQWRRQGVVSGVN